MNTIKELLFDEPDTKLFTAGACHIFAMRLHDRLGYPYFEIPCDSHVVYELEVNLFLDVFGCFRLKEYVSGNALQSSEVNIAPISEKQLKSRFSLEVKPNSFYMNEQFCKQASSRADAWIDEHLGYYIGTYKREIPRLSRLKHS